VQGTSSAVGNTTGAPQLRGCKRLDSDRTGVLLKRRVCGCRGRAETRDGFLREGKNINKTLRKRDRKEADRARCSSLVYYIKCRYRITCTGEAATAVLSIRLYILYIDELQVLFVRYRSTDDVMVTTTVCVGSYSCFVCIYLHTVHQPAVHCNNTRGLVRMYQIVFLFLLLFVF